MNIRKEINVFNNGQKFTVSYVSEKYEKTDSTVAVYDEYKMSILLTDGLAAVINDTVIDIGKNNILFFRPDEIHFGRFFRSGIHQYLDLYFPLCFFDNFRDNHVLTEIFEDKSNDRMNYIIFDEYRQKNIADTAKNIIDLLSANDAISDCKIYSMMLQIISMCAELYKNQKSNYIKVQLPTFVSQTLLYISKHFDEKISLTLLAEKSGCSIAYLSRIFKQYTGTTIYKHITSTRIGHAQTMLKKGATVTEACFSCGFDDCSNFIKTFKKLTGETPLNYKNRDEDFLT